jgi:hypothetical protein
MEIPEMEEEAPAPPVEEPILAEPEPPLPVEAVPEEIVEAQPTEPIAEVIPPIVEAPAPVEIPPSEEIQVPEAVQVLEEEITPPQVVEEVPVVAEPEPVEAALEDVELVIAPPIEDEVPAGPIASQRAYLDEHPRDFDAWLAFARELWKADERTESLNAYARLVRSGRLLESVIPDLESRAQQWSDVGMQRMLGDAYMKDGRLDEALNTYRRALDTL